MAEITSTTKPSAAHAQGGLASQREFVATVKFARTSAAQERTRGLREPFDEIVDGLRVNFAPGAKIRCLLVPKTNPFLSPPDFDCFVRVDVEEISSSNFVTLERPLDPGSWHGAKRFQVVLSGASNAPLSGSVRFRLYKGDDTFVDFELGGFKFSNSRIVQVLSGLLPESLFSETEYTSGRILIFGEAREMIWDMYYVSIEFHG